MPARWVDELVRELGHGEPSGWRRAPQDAEAAFERQRVAVGRGMKECTVFVHLVR